LVRPEFWQPGLPRGMPGAHGRAGRGLQRRLGDLSGVTTRDREHDPEGQAQRPRECEGDRDALRPALTTAPRRGPAALRQHIQKG
jgi:hypothetical protein